MHMSMVDFVMSGLHMLHKIHRSVELTLCRITGIETLSLYGQHFFKQLSKLEDECDHTRRQSHMTGSTGTIQDGDGLDYQ